MHKANGDCFTLKCFYLASMCKANGDCVLFYLAIVCKAVIYNIMPFPMSVIFSSQVVMVFCLNSDG